MAGTVTAKEGDTLCGIAIRSGFHDCTLLRAEAANASLLNRPLLAGDTVTVPAITTRTAGASTATTHRYRMRRLPEPAVRLVHGSPTLPAARDRSLDHLEISNYQPSSAGANGTASFPSAYGFNADADADVDCFKVELVSPDGGASVKVLLEALKPVYAADGSVARHELFAGTEYNARRLEVDCQLVQGYTKRYRSKYLRLVVDEVEQASLPDQTLLVTDMSDGLNGVNDRVEILDQRVRASYALPKCPVAGASQCRVACEVPVGKDKMRIPMAIHVYRTAPGGAPVGGLTEQMIRRRVWKWFRRTYAQANLSVRLEKPQVEFIDPPESNMIVIGHITGRLASGVAPGGGPSHLSFELWTIPASGGTPPVVRVPLAAGMTPTQVGAAIVTALPAGFSGQAFTNPVEFGAIEASCDVLVSGGTGIRTVVRVLSTDDTNLRSLNSLLVSSVNLALVRTLNGAESSSRSVDMRRIARDAVSSDTRLDFYVVGSLTGAWGIALPPRMPLGLQHRPVAPLRWAAILAQAVMDGSDNHPFTLAHEAGHNLLDAFHADGSTALGGVELMSDAGEPTVSMSTATSERRIADSPLQVSYGMFDPAQPTPGASITTLITPAQRLRTQSASFLVGW